MPDRRGFTLIESLAVIAIIAVLIAPLLSAAQAARDATLAVAGQLDPGRPDPDGDDAPTHALKVMGLPNNGP